MMSTADDDTRMGNKDVDKMLDWIILTFQAGLTLHKHIKQNENNTNINTNFLST